VRWWILSSGDPGRVQLANNSLGNLFGCLLIGVGARVGISAGICISVNVDVGCCFTVHAEESSDGGERSRRGMNLVR